MIKYEKLMFSIQFPVVGSERFSSQNQSLPINNLLTWQDCVAFKMIFFKIKIVKPELFEKIVPAKIRDRFQFPLPMGQSNKEHQQLVAVDAPVKSNGPKSFLSYFLFLDLCFVSPLYFQGAPRSGQSRSNGVRWGPPPCR